ncbi:MAG: alanine racemase [Planctomycetes bacterium]|nr:alanine racemase [Planctomycetota bacterium]
MPPTSTVELDLTRLDHNIAQIRRIIGSQVRLCCVLKADGYGLGAPRIAQRMESLGVDMLAVYTPDQALQLVTAGISRTPILVFMPLDDLDRTNPLYRSLISGRLHCVVHDEAHLDRLARLGHRYGCSVPVHVEIDTGMSRGGIAPQQAGAVLQTIQQNRYVRLAGLLTHYANADNGRETTIQQLDAFQAFLNDHAAMIPTDCTVHSAGTHAMFRFPQTHQQMVRIGLAWAGYGPDDEDMQHPETGEMQAASSSSHFLPIARWRSSIVHVKRIEAETPVGYGWTWKARRPTRIGLVPVGYADGYPVALSNRAMVMVRTLDDQWYPAPVIGRVSMDQMTIDLTDFAPEQIILGSEVELFGCQRDAPNDVPMLAQQSDSIMYELLCRLSPRIPRVYRIFEKSPEPCRSDQKAQTDPCRTRDDAQSDSNPAVARCSCLEGKRKDTGGGRHVSTHGRVAGGIRRDHSCPTGSDSG